MPSVNIVQLDQGNFDDTVASKDKLVLVDFWAGWCGPCRAIEPHMDQIAEGYVGKAIVGKVNVDDCRAIAERFNIMNIPTVLLFCNGEHVETVVGARQLQDYKDLLDKHL